MPTNRANLDASNSNSIYAGLTVIMIILSFIGLYLYIQIGRPSSSATTVPTPTPTPDWPSQFVHSDDFDNNVASSSPTSELVPTAVSTPTIKSFTSDVDNFTVSYPSSRTLYQDKEGSGNRYTFYSPSGNIAVHIGTKWAWIYPTRLFTENFLVSSLPTFVYEIDTQTIVDFQSNGKNYTIQCVHNGNAAKKSECQQFISDFKLTTGS